MDSDEPVVSDWHLWCRLCAKEEVEGNINAFYISAQRDNESLTDINLATTIQNYFGLNIIASGELSEMLCIDCVSYLTSLVNFSERIGKVQQLYKFLQEETIIGGTTIDLDAARLKYGLLDGAREPLPEMHYYDPKPKLNELQTEFSLLETDRGHLTEEETKLIELHTEYVGDPDMTITENLQVAPIEEENEYYLEEDEEEEVLDEVLELDPFDDGTGEYICSDDGAEQDVLDDQDYKGYFLEDSRCSSDVMELIDDESDTAKDVCQKRQRKPKIKPEGSEDKSGNVCVRRAKMGSSDQTMIYTCDECSRQFQRFYHYRAHMERAHSQIIPLLELTCPDCPRVFSAQYQLNEHVKKHVPTELKKTVPCPFCDKKFCSNTVVRTHIRFIHNDERSFICEECGVSMRTAVSLKSHMLTHTDATPFVCDICNKRFKDRIGLKKHMEIHDPTKHTCKVCGKQLNSRATLNTHLLVHSDERKHKCDYCERAFKTSKALKVHLILHTGLRPYFCEFCDRSFNNASNFRVHKRNVHPEQMAAQQASGRKNYTLNIPKIETLKAVAKTAKNLWPVGLKRSGCKPPPNENVRKRNRRSKLRPIATPPDTEHTKNALLPAPDTGIETNYAQNNSSQKLSSTPLTLQSEASL